LPRQRLQQALAIELEALHLQLTLLRGELAFAIEAACGLGPIGQSAPQHVLALPLLLLELLVFQTLLKLQRFHAARVRRREILRAAADALLQLEIQGVLLSLELETPVLEIIDVG
jgi:hypothetical protein